MVKKAVVAMSGGVDSSVTAALMVEQGYDVVGITMHLSDEVSKVEQTGTCCAPDDAHDARQVAAALGIPHYVANYKKQFKTAVIDRFVRDYANGNTPSPCVRCNDVLKFRLLLQRARALGADILATGHYARIIDDGNGPRLYRGIDHKKDQSYFLFGAQTDALRQVRFPVGELNKEQVREVARRHNLPVANKPESQDICFVPDGDYASFVEKHHTPEPGTVVDKDGNTLATHAGVHRFTIGQRRGLGLPGGGPKRFVIGISAGNGQITVGGEDDLLANGLHADRCNWIGPTPVEGQPVLARVRHRSVPVPATVVKAGGELLVQFRDPIRAVAPGQAAVLYAADEPERVLGGGWIRSAIRDEVVAGDAVCRA
ncbi:MAG: tRNA 2-thiouridine(34) synthase MnmA [Myxococcota bacterium]|nr:tRNA 2-thiouridine(34) synthase MnmA [Myxococcota bacterium]